MPANTVELCRYQRKNRSARSLKSEFILRFLFFGRLPRYARAAFLRATRAEPSAFSPLGADVSALTGCDRFCSVIGMPPSSPFQRIIKINYIDQEIDEGPHPRRQPAAVAHIDDV